MILFATEMHGLIKTLFLIWMVSFPAFASEVDANTKSDVRFLIDGASYVGVIRRVVDGIVVTNFIGKIAARDVESEMRQAGLDVRTGEFFLFLYKDGKTFSEGKGYMTWAYAHALSIIDTKDRSIVMLFGKPVSTKKFISLLNELIDADRKHKDKS